MKSHQFGLAGRYVRTHCVNRWGVKMLLAIVQSWLFIGLGNKATLGLSPTLFLF